VFSDLLNRGQKVTKSEIPVDSKISSCYFNLRKTNSYCNADIHVEGKALTHKIRNKYIFRAKSEQSQIKECMH